MNLSQKDENGKLINRHSITDLEFSDPTDLERMGKLGVIAEIYPQIQSIANRKDKLAMIEERLVWIADSIIGTDVKWLTAMCY